VSDLDRDIREALERAGADDLGAPRARHYREAQPMPDSPDWGPLRIVQPATPWHLLGVGAVLWLLGRMLGRAALADPLELVGVVFVLIAVLSLAFLPRPQPKRWRGRLVELDDSWRARLYRRIYRR
jgi:hypothetical protein